MQEKAWLTSNNIAGFSARLLAKLELGPRARCTAEAVVQAVSGAAVNVYLLSSHDGVDVWVPRASVGDVTVHDAVPMDSGTLGAVAEEKAALIFSGPDLAREDYGHLDIRKTFQSLVYLPLSVDDKLVGAIEILSFDASVTEDQLDMLTPFAEVAGPALVASQRYEDERHSLLTSISRLAQLYDLEKAFSSTLELEELLPLIGTKFRDVLECGGINIWMLQGDESLELMQQAGADPTVEQGAIQRSGEGMAWQVSDTGEAVHISDPSDERLIVPIMDKGFLVGVVEAVNKLDGPFTDDDLFALTSITETASIALHNASMLLAERKVQILETLVTVSNEITATLNLERMLQTIVNAPQAVIPYDRAGIGLYERGTFKLAAVTGITQLDTDAPDIRQLDEVMRWAALAGDVVYVRQHGDDIDSARPETRSKFEKYFRESGMRSFYAIPLNDDAGRVGILALEASDPDFLSPAHKEIVQVLAGQATVALRNAQIYGEVPFISLLEPILHRKRQFMAMGRGRRAVMALLAIGIVAFLVAWPLPLRVDGNAVVAPVRRANVQPEVEGVIGKVFVREGDLVEQGQVLAEMNAWQYRSALAAAEASYQTTQLHMNRALAFNNGTEAGMQRVQADYWKAEVERARGLLEKTQLRSPISGAVATPHVENMVGRHLELGDRFAEVVDVSEVLVNVAVEDADTGLLTQGQTAVLKMNSNPLRTFRGNVVVVSPNGASAAGLTVFYARVAVRNDDRSLRTGMEGRGKVSVGWYPAGYVIFRRPAIWLYSQVWSWVGW